MASLRELTRILALGGTMLCVVASGCGAHPGDSVRRDSPPTASTSAFDPDLAKASTMRIRSVSCEGVATGSGFLYDDHTIVTNRHVVDGAYKLTIETWDGRTLEHAVSRQAYFADLGIVELRDPIGDTARLEISDPRVGDRVHTSGYPEGGRWTTTTGTVTDLRHDAGLGTSGLVVVTDAKVLPGNSGGPMFDDGGRLIGVTYAKTTSSGESLAVAASTLRSMVDTKDEFRSVRPC